MKNIKNNILKVTVLIMSFYTQISEGTTIDDLQVEVANYEQDEVVSFVPISVDDFTIIVPVGSGIPDNPGSDGNMTIEGIDADKDGIRDDVEREIGLYYPENPTARAYSYILASRLQHIIEKPLDKNTYIQSIKDMSFAESCLDGITVSQEYKGIVFVLPLVLNTYNRSLAYIDARGLIGGELIPDMLTCY